MIFSEVNLFHSQLPALSPERSLIMNMRKFNEIYCLNIDFIKINTWNHIIFHILIIIEIFFKVCLNFVCSGQTKFDFSQIDYGKVDKYLKIIYYSCCEMINNYFKGYLKSFMIYFLFYFWKFEDIFYFETSTKISKFNSNINQILK